MKYLTDITHHIEHDNNDRYVVVYTKDNKKGTCIYQISKPLSRFQQGNMIIQMTQCNMSDIISNINDKTPLSEGDLLNLQMEIRTDSLSILRDYLSSGSSDTI